MRPTDGGNGSPNRCRTHVEARVDALRAEISEFDPLPFADDESQWTLALEEVIDGIW
ncbi:hypothetical protein ACFT9I_02560 [Streptomyces sp. NPDC057137]|uniref:hypothetical protein n=1 Tax=Streptomyces sp. NPDC057137 TaxID=3346030 RepID=UPI003643CE89